MKGGQDICTGAFTTELWPEDSKAAICMCVEEEAIVGGCGALISDHSSLVGNHLCSSYFCAGAEKCIFHKEENDKSSNIQRWQSH